MYMDSYGMKRRIQALALEVFFIDYFYLLHGIAFYVRGRNDALYCVINKMKVLEV